MSAAHSHPPYILVTGGYYIEHGGGGKELEPQHNDNDNIEKEWQQAKTAHDSHAIKRDHPLWASFRPRSPTSIKAAVGGATTYFGWKIWIGSNEIHRCFSPSLAIS